MKRVYIEPGWQVHSYYRTMALHAPEGYRFVLGGSPLQQRYDVPAGSSPAGAVLGKALASLNRQLDTARGSGVVRRLQRDVLERALPLNLAKSCLERRVPPPPGTDLTLAVNHVVLRCEPWILEAEHIAFCLSYRGEWLDSARLRRLLEKVLAGSWCRKIVSSSQAAKRNVLRYLDCERFEDKLAVVPFALPVQPLSRARRDDGKVRLLFVGSNNLPDRFYDRGGPEVLECFRVLRQRYPNLELIVRSEVPAAMRSQFAGLPGLRLLDSPLSSQAMVEVYGSADVLLSPGDHTPWSSVLEAMSYELPVVATDVFANGELVREGETGFLVAAPNAGRRGPHREEVAGLVEKVSALVEDAQLRQRMGWAGRREVEEGAHSMKHRNRELKEVLDEATADPQVAAMRRRDKAGSARLSGAV